jgi:hypothetical protein
MRQFNDKNGQPWTLDLPFGEVLRVKAASNGKFNLLEAKGLADKLIDDDAEFWEMLWHLITPQAKERNHR